MSETERLNEAIEIVKGKLHGLAPTMESFKKANGFDPSYASGKWDAYGEMLVVLHTLKNNADAAGRSQDAN